MTHWRVSSATLLALALFSCTGAGGDSPLAEPDASRPPDSGTVVDADTQMPDASPLPPDAAPLPPDAAPLPPDAGTGGGSGTSPTYPTQHPRIYIGANRQRLTSALATGRPAATRFRSVVDNWVAGTDYWGFRSWSAALMGQLTADPKYCTKAVAVVEAQVTAAEAAIAAGRAPAVAGDSYLEIGGDIGDLALVYDWCFANLSSTQKSRWIAYANQAVWNVWHPSQAKWGSSTIPWTGWATNDPANNYYYSFLRATMLLGLATRGENSQADAWLTQFRDTKVLGQLVPTFNADLVGGGSREGTGYGTAMNSLFLLYDFWKATTGEDLASKTGHTRASMLTFMHQVMPTLDRFAPTGDQSRDSTAAMFDYQRAYLQELVALFPADPVSPRALTMLAMSSVPQMTQAFNYWGDFLYDSTAAPQPLAGLNTTRYASGIGQLYMRSSWDKNATWVNLIAGPYTQSHAHQDQGSLMIYKEGWLAHDAVIHSHSGLRQETGAHGLVRIDSGGSPVRQIASTISKLVALHTGPGWVYAASDLTPAYKNNPAISKVQREVVYLQPDVVVVYDRVTSAAGTTQTWQLPTPVRPTLAGATATIASNHTLNVRRLVPATATSAVHDYKAADADFGGGFRLDETSAGGDVRHLHVLSIDNSVTSATATGDTTATVVLANGTTVRIAFNRDTVGATLTHGATTTTLAAGVDTLPE
ncbi:MAG: hypothetical protein SFX73_07315 [Kofleriaceae bacterium]|nr:hypothetical protein [Kofleriaceae bacterium]